MRKLLLFLQVIVCITACNSKKNAGQNVAVVNPIAETHAETTVHEERPQLVSNVAQVFTVPAKTVKMIQGRNGLRIVIDPTKLETGKGQQVTGDVEVTIKELTNARDMVADNAPTISNGRLLVSGGSYYVGMTSGGNELRIKKDASLKMEFPKFSDTKMELFYGQRTNDGSVNWQPADQQLKATRTSYTQTTFYPANKDNITAMWKQQEYMANTGIKVDATKGYMASIRWLKAYEDSIWAARKKWVEDNCSVLKPEQIKHVMHWPIRISARDNARLRIPFTQQSFNNGALSHISIDKHSSLEVTYYLKKARYTDSMDFYKDSIWRNNSKDIKWFSEDEKLRENSVYTGDLLNGAGINSDPSVFVDSNDTRGIQTGTKVTFPGKTTVSIQYYDPVEIKQIGWINCDHFYNNPGGVLPQYTFNIEGKVPAAFGVYTIFRNINSMISEQVTGVDTNSIVMKANLPINTSVEFLLYGKIDDKFVECKRIVTVSKNMSVPVAFTPVPEEQVKKLFLN